MKGSARKFKLTPLGISLFYLVAAGLWIILTDEFLESKLSDAGSLTLLQTYKGWLFVGFTSAILYLLISRHEKVLNKQRAKLEESKTLLAKTFDSLEESVIIINPETHSIIDCNQATTKIFGYTKEELIDSSTRLLHVDEDKFREFDSLGKKALAEEDVFQTEFTMMKKNGEIFYTDHTVSLVYNDRDEVDRVVSVIRDITHQKKTTEALKHSEKKYRHIFENNPVPMWIFNPETLEFVEVNQAAVRQYGYSREEFNSMTLEDIRPTDDIEALKEDVRKHLHTDSYGEEWVHLKKDGKLIDVKISAADITYNNSRYRLVLANDVTDQKRVQERIVQSIIETEDRERKRFSQELHDGLGQYLVSVNMLLESIKSHIDPLPERKQKQFETARNLLKNAISESRNIAQNLMPRVIEDYGLIMAVDSLMENVLESSKIKYSFRHNLDDNKISLTAQLNIYRIIQEALTNAIKYAQCTKISVQIYEKEEEISLTIEDNGLGVRLDEESEEKGIGLKSMKIRASAMSGELQIDSSPGKGMTIYLDIPLSPNTKDQ